MYIYIYTQKKIIYIYIYIYCTYNLPPRLRGHGRRGGKSSAAKRAAEPVSVLSL